MMNKSRDKNSQPTYWKRMHQKLQHVNAPGELEVRLYSWKSEGWKEPEWFPRNNTTQSGGALDSRILTQKETYEQKIIFDYELQSSEPGQNGCRLRRDMESHLGVSKLKKILVIREMAAKTRTDKGAQKCSIYALLWGRLHLTVFRFN